MKIVVKEPGKPLEIKETSEQYMTDCGKLFIPNGDIRRFVLYDTVCFLYDDEACYKNLETCFYLFSPALVFPIQEIKGTIVFCRLKPVNPWEEIWDYEVDDLTDEDVKHITEILSIDTMGKLEEYMSNLVKEKR